MWKYALAGMAGGGSVLVGGELFVRAVSLLVVGFRLDLGGTFELWAVSLMWLSLSLCGPGLRRFAFSAS